MNIIELRKLIIELEQNPIKNKELLKFYKQKDTELIRKINQDINAKLKQISPFISTKY
tara:strand:- start:590 stop:763 length:174 start_codon:yes stop_codon:yes gene_type:complete